MFRFGWFLAIGGCLLLLLLLAIGPFSPYGPGFWAYGYGWNWFPGFWFPFMPLMGVGMLAVCMLARAVGGRPGHSFWGCSTGGWGARHDDEPSDNSEGHASQGKIT